MPKFTLDLFYKEPIFVTIEFLSFQSCSVATRGWHLHSLKTSQEIIGQGAVVLVFIIVLDTELPAWGPQDFWFPQSTRIPVSWLLAACACCPYALAASCPCMLPRASPTLLCTSLSNPSDLSSNTLSAFASAFCGVVGGGRKQRWKGHGHLAQSMEFF